MQRGADLQIWDSSIRAEPHKSYSRQGPNHSLVPLSLKSLLLQLLKIQLTKQQYTKLEGPISPPCSLQKWGVLLATERKGYVSLRQPAQGTRVVCRV